MQKHNKIKIEQDQLFVQPNFYIFLKANLFQGHRIFQRQMRWEKSLLSNHH